MQNSVKNVCRNSIRKNSAGAGALIVTTFVKGLVGFDNDGNPVNEAGDGWGYYDLGLQNENLLLKATELGLDTLVMGIRDGEAIREMLNIPETENVVAVIAVGYKAKRSQYAKKKRIRRNRKILLKKILDSTDITYKNRI